MKWPTPDPVAFSIFGFDIRWYGVLIACAMLLGVGIAYFRAPRFRLKRDHVIDLALVAFPCAVVGARLYYVLLNWADYSGDLLRIIDIRGGGLAIHGGLLGGILGGWICCRIKKIRFSDVLDLVAPSIVLGQAIGRWGNFFNQEAHGGPTDLPWAIEVNGQMVHPTFLYESLWCFLLFWILLYISRGRKFSGQIFLLYGMLYSLERFLVEGLRTDSLMIFDTIRMAQALSLAVIVIFGFIYIVLRKKARRRRIFY